MREDYYVHRWFMHVFDMAGDQIETCTNNMIKALRWRKDENVRGMVRNIFRAQYGAGNYSSLPVP